MICHPNAPALPADQTASSSMGDGRLGAEGGRNGRGGVGCAHARWLALHRSHRSPTLFCRRACAHAAAVAPFDSFSLSLPFLFLRCSTSPTMFQRLAKAVANNRRVATVAKGAVIGAAAVRPHGRTDRADRQTDQTDGEQPQRQPTNMIILHSHATHCACAPYPSAAPHSRCLCVVVCDALRRVESGPTGWMVVRCAAGLIAGRRRQHGRAGVRFRCAAQLPLGAQWILRLLRSRFVSHADGWTEATRQGGSRLIDACVCAGE